MKKRLIESDAFPIDFISSLATAESWRKDIHRPIYHLHKWWAKRLGSVFRGVVLGAILDDEAHLEKDFYSPSSLKNLSVLDPFMGSGTTLGESHKLGCVALGKDINPVSCESVRVALSPVQRKSLQAAYSEIEEKVSSKILGLYRCTDSTGKPARVLYYFWVKQVCCPVCTQPVDLFSSRIFSQNAYPTRKPTVQVCCPRCSGVFASLYSRRDDTCPHCLAKFGLHEGNVNRNSAVCSNSQCGHLFSILKEVQTTKSPPKHRLYAKLLLREDGEKEYSGIEKEDLRLFSEAEKTLAEELQSHHLKLPDLPLRPGHNTKQALGYNYSNWRDFFNARQLLCLGWLQAAIAETTESKNRDILLQLFSSVLEFNNLFASFKGEGTGAVRHMFSHHIIKPERTPLEANLWGTEKSSGSFSNLFRAKISRLIEYQNSPSELSIDDLSKVFPGNIPFTTPVEIGWGDPGKWKQGGIYVDCGASQQLSAPDKSIDLIVTDPPFFDNVHYSELADFFFSWQTLYPHGFVGNLRGTRHVNEVQDADASSFASKLESVYRECSRVLKDDGLLTFTYHHSRSEGWEAVAVAVCNAGFHFVNAQPVKAEMSGGTPKKQAEEPIQLDIIFVCRKVTPETTFDGRPSAAKIKETLTSAHAKARRLTKSGLVLSANDRLVIFCGQAIASIGYSKDPLFIKTFVKNVLDGMRSERNEILSESTR